MEKMEERAENIKLTIFKIFLWIFITGFITSKINNFNSGFGVPVATQPEIKDNSEDCYYQTSELVIKGCEPVRKYMEQLDRNIEKEILNAKYEEFEFDCIIDYKSEHRAELICQPERW